MTEIMDTSDMDLDVDEVYEDAGYSEEEEEEELEEDDEMDKDEEDENDGKEEITFTVLNTDQIYQNMMDCINKVNGVLQLPRTMMKSLLDSFKWDSEKLLEAYYTQDENSVFKIADFATVVDVIDNTGKGGSAADQYCQICYLDASQSEMHDIGCGHKFCKKCWVSYLTSKIMDGGGSSQITCAEYKCSRIVDDSTVLKFVMDPKVRQAHQQLITNSFVQCNRLMKWCPSPDCTFAIQAHWAGQNGVICQCGHSFCFQCGVQSHLPVNCSMIKKWLQKCHDDSETANWIAANTKDCPKCGVTIEKNGGCNHMTCRSASCGNHFCWICLTDWGPDGYQSHSCSRFEESDQNQEKQSTITKSRIALERYLFYYTRYANHIQSMKLEKNVLCSVQEKNDYLLANNISGVEAQFLVKAVETLRSCRQTLMHTHVFAFYVIKNNQSSIFEDNQQDLESATEKLSEYLERELTFEEDAFEMKRKVQDMFRYCDMRRKVILDHVQEGYDKGWWTFN